MDKSGIQYRDLLIDEIQAISLDKLESTFDTSFQTGLSDSEATLRRKQFGANEIVHAGKRTVLSSIWDQISNPLVLLLLAASIAAFLLGHQLDSLVIAIAMFVSVIVGVIQEGRASRAFEVLATMEEKHAVVLRGGKKRMIHAEEVVLGDIVVVELGSGIPADIRLVSAANLEVTEAALTGESMPVLKDAHGKEDANMVWQGSVAVGGTGEGVVVKIGHDTRFGAIAEELGGKEKIETPIKKAMKRLAHVIAFVAFVILIGIVVLGIVRGNDFATMLLVGIAVAVSAVPEGLPAAVTVVLAIGMESILKRGGLVKNLLAAETLGSTTVILTDKTGTLTQAKMSLVEAITPRGTAEERLLRAAVRSSDAYVENGEGDDVVRGRPLERAILTAALRKGMDEIEAKQSEQIVDSILFSSQRKYAARLLEEHDGYYLYISGAPEKILAFSTHVANGPGGHVIDGGQRDELRDRMVEAASHGGRVIAVATLKLADPKIPRTEDGGLDAKSVSVVFEGLLVFEDPIREDVVREIERCREAGVRVVMVTGDNPDTALSIARKIGIAGDTTATVLGKDLDALSDEELAERVYGGAVFARVLPTHKKRIATVLRRRGEVVAMTGDGVNDAPALKGSDVGVALGSGTDVAKEAADLVLVEDSFSVIVAAIEEGRRIRDNLKRILTHLISGSFSGVYLIIGALVFALPLPILPAQIIWLNMIEGGFLSFAFAFEPAAPGIMKRVPNRKEAHKLISREIGYLIAFTSACIGMFTLMLFIFLHGEQMPLEKLRSIMFVALSLDTLLFTLSLKDFYNPFWKTKLLSNNYLLGAVLASVILIVAAFEVEPIRNLLSLELLEKLDFIILFGIALFNIFVIEIGKRLIFGRERKLLNAKNTRLQDVSGIVRA